MGNARNARRNLSERHVWLAQETERQKILLARKMVEERCKEDAEFAADVIKAVGDNLPKEIKDAAEATIARESQKTVACTTISAGLPEDPLVAQMVKLQEEATIAKSRRI